MLNLDYLVGLHFLFVLPICCRDFEPIRLLGLQFIGRLLVGIPSEKKGARFFGLGVGRSRSLSESCRYNITRMQPIFSAISERIFKFPQTDNLCATLFDVLLGGASPKQVISNSQTFSSILLIHFVSYSLMLYWV